MQTRVVADLSNFSATTDIPLVSKLCVRSLGSHRDQAILMNLFSTFSDTGKYYIRKNGCNRIRGESQMVCEIVALDRVVCSYNPGVAFHSVNVTSLREHSAPEDLQK